MSAVANKRKLIAIDTSLIVSTQLEGLGQYVANIVNELQKKDQDNRYLIFRPFGHRDLIPVTGSNFRVINTPNCLLNPILNIVWCSFVLPFVLLWQRADAIHLPDPRRFLIWKPCKVVTTVHDVMNFKLKGRVGFVRRFYHAAIRKRLVGQGDVFITVSENSKKDMVEIGFPSERIRVVSNGVSSAFRVRDKGAAAKELALNYRLPDKFVLCVSRLEHPQKNHVTLLRAWSKLTGLIEHKLVLVGKKWWNSHVIFEEIEKLGLKKDVMHLDFIDSKQLPLFYNASDLFVFPSLYEGFGLPVLESMASGIPVIAANNSSLKEYFSDSAKLVSSQNEDEWAAEIKSVLGNKAVRSSLIESGFRKASSFTWGQSALKHIEIYQSL